MISEHEGTGKENISPQTVEHSTNYYLSTPSGTSKRLKTVMNPFESGLLERMKRKETFLSPGIFERVRTKSSSSSCDTEFQWTIDDLSKIDPVPIDEDQAHSQCINTLDPEKESHLQEEIVSYFKHQHVVHSPWTKSLININCAKAASSTPEHKIKCNVLAEKCNIGTQTMLSLPPELPENLEEMLKPYFLNEVDTSFDETDSLNLSNSRRKLKFSPDDNSIIASRSSPPLGGHYLYETVSLLPSTPLIKSRTLFTPSKIDTTGKLSLFSPPTHMESPIALSPVINVCSKSMGNVLQMTSSPSPSTSGMSTNETVEDVSMISCVDTTHKYDTDGDKVNTDQFQDTGYHTEQNSSGNSKNSL